MFSYSLSAPPKSKEVTFTINQIRMAQKLISASLFSPLMVLLRQAEMSFPRAAQGIGARRMARHRQRQPVASQRARAGVGDH